MPFLTLEDPNAKIKGSRDPLGVQPMWASFGRRVVTNLTTQSTSVRGFTVLLLGRYFAVDLIDRGMASREDALDIFLRMEQLGAYVRHVGHGVEGEIRGIERVKRFVDEHRGRVPIHADRRGMILADQKVYGLWGLYSVPARTSGLIPEGSLDVTPAAHDLIERRYLSRLNGAGQRLRHLLARGGTLNTRGGDLVFEALAAILAPRFGSDERELYGNYLRDGLQVADSEPERQRRLRSLLESESTLETPLGRAEILHLAKRARRNDEGLATSLERIAHLEALLAPAAALFQHVLSRHDQRLDRVGEEIAQRWGKKVPNLDRSAFESLLGEIRAAATGAIASRMEELHAALNQGDYVEAILALVSWNALVMETRGGAPWVRVGDRHRLDVRYRGIEQLLPETDELPALWVNSYFIDSLKAVTQQLRA